MVKHYDCTKTRDCIHEYHRLCTSYPAGCESSCPLIGVEICSFDIFENEDAIASLQKWSDEHPEAPKLTKKDYSFLNCFGTVNKYIKRQYGVLSVLWNGPTITINPMEIPIDATMFKCVEKGQKWSFEDLLKLEVEE